jgi:hypothetical protein
MEYLLVMYYQDGYRLHDLVIKLDDIEWLETWDIVVGMVWVIILYGPHWVSSFHVMHMERMFLGTYFGSA